jgi:hypothetical protein
MLLEITNNGVLIQIRNNYTSAIVFTSKITRKKCNFWGLEKGLKTDAKTLCPSQFT